MFCKYKNIFGKVNKGIHSVRLFDIAIIDVILTIILSYIIKKYFPKIHFLYILIYLFLLGIILHKLFCVKTKINKLLFNN